MTYSTRQVDFSHIFSHDMLSRERPRLVRFCAHLTTNAAVAEDLAQETLLEAWRNTYKLSALPENPIDRQMAVHKWLCAIARNVCLRWLRLSTYDHAHTTSFTQCVADEYNDVNCIDNVSDPFDIEIELERDELAILLDRALVLLPPTMREVLIQRYIHESPYADIATRLDLSEEVLAQRLHRGKLALRRVFSSQLRVEASAFDLITYEKEQHEQETRIWCPMCNGARLMSYTTAEKWIGFRCPACWHIAGMDRPEVWSGLRNPKGILNRQIAALSTFYWPAIEAGQGLCPLCQSSTSILVVQPEDVPSSGASPMFATAPCPYICIHIVCNHCDYNEYNPLPHLTLDVPETSHFWHKHPRMRWLPPQEIEYAGSPALISSFQSMTDSARLDVMLDRTNLRVLGVHQS